MPTEFPDPFLNDDPLFQPYELQPDEEEFSMPDLKSRDLGDFLRSLEPRLPPPTPTTTGGRVIGYITGYP
jgi:hypothetical protein